MRDLSNKFLGELAEQDPLDKELDNALKDMGLPGVSALGELDVDLQQLPEIMRICNIRPWAERHRKLHRALAAGADPNVQCRWGAMPIDTLYTDGDATGLSLLLDHGVDATDYGWSDAHLAVISDDQAALVACAPSLMARTDRLGDTPFQLACRLRRDAVARLLMPTEPVEDAILIAAQTGRVAVISALVAAGADVNYAAADGATALLLAVESGHADMVAYLLGQGVSLDAAADISVPQNTVHPIAGGMHDLMDLLMPARHDIRSAGAEPLWNTIYTCAFEPEIIRLLVAHGADPAKFADEAFPIAIGVDQVPKTRTGRHEFAAQHSVRFGQSNPERVDLSFWKSQIQTGATGADARRRIVGHQVCTDAPVWSFNRSGRSATQLDDGRLVLIGGRHQDDFDPDFWIYNDVTIVGDGGEITQFIYPNTAFPPTDFHTATLVEDGIWIIGCNGYQHQHRPDATQVLWLSLTDFSMHPVQTTGQRPGWIHRHQATLLDGAIHVSGGQIAPSDKALSGSYILDLQTLAWHRVN